MMDNMKTFDTEGDPRYLLMNKDVVIAHFHVKSLTDSVEIESIETEIPHWIQNLRTFIMNRRAPKSRENIERLLKESGCDTIQGYLNITHALSLVDTFWVKPVDSRLSWENVSLYTHAFNETIAKTAFEGGLHGRHLSDTSPEYGTDGTFAKCWIRENEQIKLLKRGSSGARNAGLEPYSEFYASQLIQEFTRDFVNYDLRSRSGRICSVCDIFTSEEFGFLPYASLEPGNSDYLSVIEKYESMGFGDFARTMFIVDAVILNEDRHKNNFGFLVDNARQEIVAPAPLFDHNIALLPYGEEEDFSKIDEYLDMKGPKLSRDWVRTAVDCMTPNAKRALIHLKGFEFKRHPQYNLPEWRLKALENIINQNIEAILSFV